MLIKPILLGLATSFHVLVGGWALITTLGWFCLRPKERLLQVGNGFVQIAFFTRQAIAVPVFPSEQQDVDPQWKLMSD